MGESTSCLTPSPRNSKKNAFLYDDRRDSDGPTDVDVEIANEFQVKMSVHGVHNGLLQLKLDGIDSYIIRYLRHMRFRLEYQIIIETEDNDKWTEISFNHRFVSSIPQIHINIRLGTNLSSYNMQFRLKMMTTKTFSQRRIDKPLMPKHVWCSWSNTVVVEIPPLMKERSLQIDDWVKFRIFNSRTNRSKWTFGVITEKRPALNGSNIENDDDINDTEYIYTIRHHQSFRKYDIRASSGNIENISCMNYLDLSPRIDADLLLLIGDRIDIDTESIKNIYSILYDMFYTEYALKLFTYKMYKNNVDYISMSKCISLNVIDFLWNKDKGYKIRCCMNDKAEPHYNDILQLMPTRAYQIGRVRDLKFYTRLDSIFYCDLCMCRQGDYEWMFRCQLTEIHRYNGHDLCIMCIYDIIKLYKQLTDLLHDVLTDQLSTDCIQSIVTYTVGSIVKL